MQYVDRASVPPVAPDAGTALARGIAFLAAEQQPDGGFLNLFWDGDAPPVRAFNVFPAALVAHSLSFAPEGKTVRARALDFLRAEASPEGVWKHWSSAEPNKASLPPDVDDTACASAALRDGGRDVPDNAALLLANRSREGLFYTWFTWRPRGAGLAHFRLVLPQLRQLRWLIPLFTRTIASIYNVDAVVNANALFYLGRRPETSAVEDYLLGILRNDAELRCDTWYFDPFVIWYFFSRALAPGNEEATRLIGGKLSAAGPQTPLQIATALCAASYCGIPPDSDRLAALRLSQGASGAWPAEYFYQGKGCYWGSEAVTTAFAVEALARCGA